MDDRQHLEQAIHRYLEYFDVDRRSHLIDFTEGYELVNHLKEMITTNSSSLVSDLISHVKEKFFAILFLRIESDRASTILRLARKGPTPPTSMPNGSLNTRQLTAALLAGDSLESAESRSIMTEQSMSVDELREMTLLWLQHVNILITLHRQLPGKKFLEFLLNQNSKDELICFIEITAILRLLLLFHQANQEGLFALTSSVTASSNFQNPVSSSSSRPSIDGPFSQYMATTNTSLSSLSSSMDLCSALESATAGILRLSLFLLPLLTSTNTDTLENNSLIPNNKKGSQKMTYIRYERFHALLKDLLDRAIHFNELRKQSIEAVLQRYIYQITNSSRTVISEIIHQILLNSYSSINLVDNEQGDTDHLQSIMSIFLSTDNNQHLQKLTNVLPITHTVFYNLLQHPLIHQFPKFILAALRSHTAICTLLCNFTITQNSLPASITSSGSSKNSMRTVQYSADKKGKIQHGALSIDQFIPDLGRQHSLYVSLCIHLCLCVVGQSWNYRSTSKDFSSIINTLIPMTISAHEELTNVSRHLLHGLIQVDMAGLVQGTHLSTVINNRGGNQTLRTTTLKWSEILHERVSFSALSQVFQGVLMIFSETSSYQTYIMNCGHLANGITSAMSALLESGARRYVAMVQMKHSRLTEYHELLEKIFSELEKVSVATLSASLLEVLRSIQVHFPPVKRILSVLREMTGAGYRVPPQSTSITQFFDLTVPSKNETPSHSLSNRIPVEVSRKRQLDFLDELESEERDSSRQLSGEQFWRRNRLVEGSSREESVLANRRVTGVVPHKPTTADNSKNDWKRQMEELRQQRDAARKAADLKSAASDANKTSTGTSRIGNGTNGGEVYHNSSAFTYEDDDDQMDFQSSTTKKVGRSDIVQHVKLIDFAALRSTTPLVSSSVTSTTNVGSSSEPISSIYSLEAARVLANRDVVIQNSAAGGASLANALSGVCIDELLNEVLGWKFSHLLDANNEAEFTPLPPKFRNHTEYISGFRPLLLAEFRAALTADLLRLPDPNLIAETSTSTSSTSTEPLQAHGFNVTDIFSTSPESPFAEVRIETDSTSSHHAFQRDDLVLILRSSEAGSKKTIESLRQSKHCLGIVVLPTGGRRRGDVHHASAASPNGAGHTVIMRRKYAQQSMKSLALVSLTSVSTFLREWYALYSIQSSVLMPLGAYLLRGTAVASIGLLMELSGQLESRIKSVEAAERYSAEEGKITLLNDLATSMENLRDVVVSSDTIRSSGIGKLLGKLSRRENFSPASDIAAEIVNQWKKQVQSTEELSPVGPNRVAIPSSKAEISPPKTLTSELWQILTANYSVSQLGAIKYVCDRLQTSQDTRVTLIQGPPGTGKTSTIVGVVSALLDKPPNAVVSTLGERILICAPSNAAIDEILTRLSSGIIQLEGATPPKFLRLGEPLPGASKLIQSLSLESQLERLLAADSLWHLSLQLTSSISETDRKLSRLISTRDTSAPDSQKSLQREIDSVRKSLNELRGAKYRNDLSIEAFKTRIRTELLSNADIIAGTLSACGKAQFVDFVARQAIHFPTVIIDEAAQASEPASLIPLRFGCRRLVLVGDPRQLPATILSRPADLGGLGRSLFERLEAAGHPVLMLSVQYRMHPTIRSFPSAYFYGNLLTDSDQIVREVALTTTPEVGLVRAEILKKLSLSPAMFVQLDNSHGQRVGMSYSNPFEVDVILSLLESLMPQIEPFGLSVAVISPYRAQVQRIFSSLQRSSKLSRYVALGKDRNEAREGSRFAQRMAQQTARLQAGESIVTHTEAVRNLIEVNSVDGFQGREKDIVILSTVRASPGNVPRSVTSAIGFVADRRRLNVAVTRSRKCLLVFGHRQTLSVDNTWRELITRIEDNGGLVQPEELSLLDNFRTQNNRPSYR